LLVGKKSKRRPGEDKEKTKRRQREDEEAHRGMVTKQTCLGSPGLKAGWVGMGLSGLAEWEGARLGWGCLAWRSGKELGWDGAVWLGGVGLGLSRLNAWRVGDDKRPRLHDIW